MTDNSFDGDPQKPFRKWWARLPLIKRLVPSLQKRLIRLAWPDGKGVAKREGVLFLLNLENWYDKVIATHGPFEPAQRAFFLENLVRRKCDTFIDIGANMGTYSLFVALRTSCPTIIAFEPDSRAYDKLRANLLLNGVSARVDTRQVALSDRSGTISFSPGPNTHDALSRAGVAGPDSRSVRAARLDDEVALSGRRIAVKIDIEAHELTALAGMRNLLHDNQCFLQVECFPENAAAYVQAMKECGYELLHRIEHDYYFSNTAG